jgi:predicted nucleotide-binding protein (sugar kinase/HSP70/actin superfamily)
MLAFMPETPASPLIDVLCPCCEAKLRVDAVTGAVIAWDEKKRAAPVEDMAEAVKRIKREEAERESKFNKALQAERSHQDVLNKKFDELLKRAKSDPDAGPPVRKPFDWD